MRVGSGAALVGAVVGAGAAQAQTAVSVGGEVATDEARRGLSWSQGRVSASADGGVTIGAVEAGARVSALRGSRRQAGADAAVDLTLGTGWSLGAIRLRATGTAHLFTDAVVGMDYGELGASGSYAYGPLRVTAGLAYAPPQDAIGGSNLYLYASGDAGIPGTPLTVVAQVGRSSGSVDDAVRAQRLRPGGSYTDWQLGVERRRGPLTLAVSYLGTDVTARGAIGPFADARHAGDRLVGRVRLEF